MQDIKATIELRNNPLANRPASGKVSGEPYFATDTKQLFVWDGSAWSQTSGSIQLTTIALTAAQMIGSYAAPFQVLPAPGAGKIIVLTFASLSYTNGSQPFEQPSAFQPALMYGNLGYIGNSAKLPVGFFNSSNQIGIFTLPSGSSAVDIEMNCVNMPISLFAPVDAGPIASISLGSSGGGGYAPGDTGTVSDGNNGAEYQVDTVTSPNSYVLTAAGNASAGHTVYTGTFTGGAGNAFVGHSFTITGFVAHTSNNGTFNCTASTATQLTLANASGIAETHAGSATDNNTGGTVLTFHLTSNGSSYTAGQTDVGTSVDSGNGDGGFLVNVNTITPGNGTAKLTLAYYTVDF